MTPPEIVMWSRLRGRRLRGHKFRRQFPIGSYVVDFACAESKVVVELDGQVHDGRRGQDLGRDQQIEEQGWRVLRFSVGVFEKDEMNVLEAILRVCNERSGS